MQRIPLATACVRVRTQSPGLERRKGTAHIPPKGPILLGWRGEEARFSGWHRAGKRAHPLGSSPAVLPGHDFEAGRVPDHLVEGADHLGEAGPRIPVFLPTVQHELMQGGGAVWGRGQPVVLFNGVDHLE